jgi:hypothetical protein
MTTTTDNTARNGVDTVALFTTIGAVTAQPELAKFQFRATNRWVDGTHTAARSTVTAARGKNTSASRISRSPPTIRRCSTAATMSICRWTRCVTTARASRAGGCGWDPRPPGRSAATCAPVAVTAAPSEQRRTGTVP